MVQLRIEKKDAFEAAGRKIWISGQDNDLFGDFWDESHANGFVGKLCAIREGVPGDVTKSNVFGVSRVEKDPNNRAFWFYIATESGGREINDETIERFTIPASEWAIFQNRGELPMSLIEAEMEAFMKWLPSSEYKHANAPEFEVYPASDDKLVEFWLPIEKK